MIFLSNILIGRLNNNLFKQNSNETRPLKNLHPSSLGACIRKSGYKYYQIPPEDKDARTLRIFQNGHYVHERIQNECIQSDDIEVVKIEAPISNDEHRVFGYIDGIIKIDSIPYILEVKSKGDKGFTNYLDKPSKEHIVQVNTYFWLLEDYIAQMTEEDKKNLDEDWRYLLEIQDGPLDKGFLFYENKDNQKQKEFLVEKNPKLISWIKKRCKFFWKVVGQNKMPNRPYDEKEVLESGYLPPECKFACDYTKVCWKEHLDKLK